MPHDELMVEEASASTDDGPKYHIKVEPANGSGETRPANERGEIRPSSADSPYSKKPSTETGATSATCQHAPGEPDVATWQWLHRTGFRNYDQSASDRIEQAYQIGRAFVRLKSGKFGEVPMEIFFADMVQHDPITGNLRNVQRVGPRTAYQTIYRRLAQIMNNLSDGRFRQLKFEDYRQRRKNLDAQSDTAPEQHLKSKRIKMIEAYNTGRCAQIVRHPLFTTLTYFMVVVNAIYIGIDADAHEDPTLTSKDVGFQVAEHFFCVYFTWELAMRFGALKRKRECLTDYWFVFDMVLLLLMVGEAWVLTIVLAVAGDGDQDKASFGASFGVLRIARLLRLARLGRVARILRIFPEIMMMLKGIFEALRSVFFTLLLLLLLLFMFGIIFKTQAADVPELHDLFPTVSRSMWVLLLRGTLLDSPSLYLSQLEEEKPELVVLFILFIFLSSFTILNMLIGILCDVVRSVSEIEKDKTAVSDLKTTILELLECFDKDDDRMIAPGEFDLLMRNPEMIQILRRHRVDPVDLVSLKDSLFGSKNAIASEDGDPLEPAEKKLSFYEFLELVLRLRGGNAASVVDIVDLREYIRHRLDGFELPDRTISSSTLKDTLPPITSSSHLNGRPGSAEQQASEGRPGLRRRPSFLAGESPSPTLHRAATQSLTAFLSERPSSPTSPQAMVASPRPPVPPPSNPPGSIESLREELSEFQTRHTEAQANVVARQVAFEQEMKGWRRSQEEAQREIIEKQISLGEDVRLACLQVGQLQKTLNGLTDSLFRPVGE